MQAGSGEKKKPEPPVWDPAELVRWLETTVFPVYLRPIGRPGMHWCSRWWAHAEAWARFTACHRAWQELVAEPGIGLSVWHRDHLDPMLKELLGENGPFAACTPRSHTDPTRARHVQPPPYDAEEIPQEQPSRRGR
ncbi:DUF4913 domain-containing protein [Amycolatopsis sp. NPDC051102]|uniref:DUF4913 domain-containing protein n=1 Tax=Amycolatopsis sp. NPDC051102 TaxID=3155163 RepID=UPI00342AA08C